MDSHDPNLWQPLSLDVLRRRLRAILDLEEGAELQNFAEALRADSRRGAQHLVQRALRRLAVQSKERARVHRMFELRRSLFEAGRRAVAGVDEVGVGPLAGRVVVVAVILQAPDDLSLIYF